METVPSPAPFLSARDLTRRWGRGPSAHLGLDRVDLDVCAGELVAVTGPSGSGKSTLGSLLAGIDRPTAGSLVVDGTRIDRMRDEHLARWRARCVGIVFQEFHLLPTLTARENVELALELGGRRVSRRDRRRRADQALVDVGLREHSRRLPAQLSGGEQQRVGIARAIVTGPRLVIADEPTGSLDQGSGDRVFELLASLVTRGTAVVLITHDHALAARAHRRVEMLDGRVTSTIPGAAPGEAPAPGDRAPCAVPGDVAVAGLAGAR